MPTLTDLPTEPVHPVEPEPWAGNDPAPVDPAPPVDRGAGPDPDLPAWRFRVLGVILAAAAALYTWALSATGAINQYYAAAAMSGSVDLKAWFFGSLDSGNFITVDKAPFALWVQVASVRLFGYSDWSLILPQAAAGVATVALLYCAVTRLAGARAGLVAAAVLTCTPVTVALTRSNLPDSFLVLCLVAGAWALTRAVQEGRLAWLVTSMVFVGLGFNAKMLQAWVVLPALGLTWLVFAPHPWATRIRHAVIGGVAALAVSFSWLAVVDLWPSSSRPYVGGSEDNTVLDLVLGYNGLGRIFGESQGGGAGSSSPFDSGVSWLRMFNAENGDQISWLLPAALIALVGASVLAWRSRDRALGAGLLLWGGWTIVTAAVFSRAEGIYHPYYTIALAPGIAALVGIGASLAWRERHRLEVAIATAVTLVVSGWWADHLLARVDGWNPWLGPTALLLSIVAAAAVVTVAIRPALGRGVAGRCVAGLALTALLVAPAVYSTASLFNETPNQSPEAGPASVADGPGAGRAGGLSDAGGPSGGGGPGESTVDQELVDYLLDQYDDERWIVAVNGSQVASPIIIETDGEPVLAFGGFNGTDPTPTADELAELVASGELRFVLVSDSGLGGGPGGGSAQGLGGGSAQGLGDDQGFGPPQGQADGQDAAAGRPQGPPPGLDDGQGAGFGPGAGGPGGDSTVSVERTAWVEDNCTLVDSIATSSGVLWDCAG